MGKDSDSTRRRHKAHGSARPPRTQTRERVRELLAEGLTNAEVARLLGLSKPTISYHARSLGIPASDKFSTRYDWDEVQRFYDQGNSISACMTHFGFARRTFWEAVRRGAVRTRPQAMPIELLLVVGRRTNRSHLKLRLVGAGLKENRCEECGIVEWRGRSLSMALHHVNGDGLDNRLENLKFLCPNCHSQTENFAGRNGRGRQANAAPGDPAAVEFAA